MEPVNKGALPSLSPPVNTLFPLGLAGVRAGRWVCLEFLCFLRVFAIHSCSVRCVCVCGSGREFFTQIPVCFLLIPFIHQAFAGLCAKILGHKDEWAIEPALLQCCSYTSFIKTGGSSFQE